MFIGGGGWGDGESRRAKRLLLARGKAGCGSGGICIRHVESANRSFSGEGLFYTLRGMGELIRLQTDGMKKKTDRDDAGPACSSGCDPPQPETDAGRKG